MEVCANICSTFSILKFPKFFFSKEHVICMYMVYVYLDTENVQTFIHFQENLKSPSSFRKIENQLFKYYYQKLDGNSIKLHFFVKILYDM